MAIGPFAVGEQPSEPLVIRVTNSDGEPVDLDQYDSMELIGYGLPEGITSIADAAAGRVQYTFTAPFADVGTVEARVVLTQEDGDVDYSPVFSFEVYDVVTSTFLSGPQVFTITGQNSSRAARAKAQSIVGLVLHRDLSDTDWLDRLGARDLGLLRQAVAWQSVFTPTLEVPPGATSVATGDVSLTFGGSSAESTVLATLTAMALSRLSWRRRSMISVRPFLGDSTRLPQDLVNDGSDSDWTPIGRAR